VGASASHQEVVNNRGYTQADQSATPDGAPLSDTQRFSSGHEWDQSTAEEIHFAQTLNRPGETLSLQAQRSGQHEREHYGDTDLYELPAAPVGYDDLGLSLDLITTEASADYVLPLAHDSKLRAGYDFEEDDDRFDDTGDTIDPVTGVPIPNSSEISHFRYRQQIHTLYGSYETARGPWSLIAGVRIEDTFVRTLEADTGVTGSQHYLRVYPNLRLDRQVSADGTLTFSASRRINRPDPQALNPYVDHQDIYNLRQGNPNLLPEDIISLEAGYAWRRRGLDLASTAFLRLSRDAVTDVTTVVGPNVLLTTKANLPSSRSAGLETSAGGSLGPRISYAVTATTFYNEIDAGPLGGTGLRSTVGVNLKAHVDFKPTPRDTLQAAFSRSDRRLTPQGYIGAIDLANFGWRRQVTPRLALLVTLSDAFDGQTYSRHLVTPTLQDSYSRHQAGQILYGGAVYTFGGPSKSKAPNFDYGSQGSPG
jgi:outer membrane receptor protein involved in Fe transport